MINNSSNLQEDTFARDAPPSIMMTFQNSNPFQNGVLDSSFPEQANIVLQQSNIKKVSSGTVCFLNLGSHPSFSYI